MDYPTKRINRALRCCVNCSEAPASQDPASCCVQLSRSIANTDIAFTNLGEEGGEPT
jgi:hypothetical protein